MPQADTDMASSLPYTALLFMALSLHAADPVILRIEDRVLHAVPGDIFGQFLERPSWGGEAGPENVCAADGRLPETVEQHLAGMHAPLVRFPFGTDGDYLDWTDMVDQPGRAQRPTSTGYQGNAVTNRFGFPEYFALADRMHWRTILVTNLREALYRKKPLAEAAEHAAALVRYARGKRIAAVQVGNEGWFFWPPKPEERAALGVAAPEDSARWLRTVLCAYADAIRRVDAEVPLICDAPRMPDGEGGEAAPIWRLAVDHADIRARYAMLAAHAYAPMGYWNCERDGKKLKFDQLPAKAVWGAAVSSLGRFDGQGQAVADVRAYDDIARMGFGVAVTEWNWNGWGWKGRFPQVTFQDGVPAALGTAGFLHGLMRHPQVRLATQSMLLGTTWGITAVRVAKDGSVGYLPQAEVTRLHAEHHGTQVVAAPLDGVAFLAQPPRLTSWWPEVEKLADVDAVVTASAARWHVHVLNRSQEQPRLLRILLPPSAPESGSGTMHLLTGSPEAHTGAAGGIVRRALPITWTGRCAQVELPPACVAVVVLGAG